MRTRLLLALLTMAACKDKGPQRVEPSPTPQATVGSASDIAAVAKPTAPTVKRVPPAKQVPWTKPTRAPSEQETLLAGTWAATVGDYGTRSLFMADRVVLGVGSSAADPIDSIVRAIEADNRVQTNCIWLELRPNFTGFRRECMLVNGVPSALDNTDPITGKKTDLGTAFEWFSDADDKNAMKLRFAADMVVPAAGPDGMRQLVFRHWTLRLSAGAADKGIAIEESFPEHDYTLPTKYSYEIHSGAYLD